MNIEIPFLKKLKIPLIQLVLGGSAALCLLLTVPQFIVMSKVAKEVAEKQKILNDLDSGIKNFELIEQDAESLSRAYNDFMASLPAQKEFPVFLELISKMAKKNNVKIIAIEPQKTNDLSANFFIKIPIYVDAYCGYHELGRFINDIEYAEKFMKIIDLKITKDDPDSEELQIFLSIGAYCLREDESV
jgi:Tfp pilus assembly protein PilO